MSLERQTLASQRAAERFARRKTVAIRIFKLISTTGLAAVCGRLGCSRLLGIASRCFALHNELMNAIYARLEEIFRTVLLDDSVTLTPETSGKDFEAWDSLTHVTVMVHVERAFDIQFTSSEISGWENVGQLAELIDARLRQKG
jgi:acyl carrier protein